MQGTLPIHYQEKSVYYILIEPTTGDRYVFYKLK